ncbi:MAG: hypothetical protein QM756_43495 [Polyangiaceae bacterium]
MVIRSERFRLSGDKLVLRRAARGVHVEGSGVLGLCPCERPPLAFGLRAADLAPPSDVLLASATLRVFGIPVLWLPYLRLQLPNRAGLMPPFVTYRAEEGLLLGSGVHLPLAEQPGAALDVSAAGYVRGGARLEGRLTKPGVRVEIGFDQFFVAARSTCARPRPAPQSRGRSARCAPIGSPARAVSKHCRRSSEPRSRAIACASASGAPTRRCSAYR